MNKPVLAITMGDPSGVGPEIILKALAREDVRASCAPLVVGSAGVLHRVAGMLGLPEAGIIVLDIPADLDKIQIGVEGAESGRVAVEAVRLAVELVLANQAAAIVTAPLNKRAISLAGFPYPGHTEMLAELSGAAKVAMLLVTPTLRVIHVSTHVSLSEAIERVRPERIRTVIEIADRTLRRMKIERPRIAVAGLNPHAGEGGLFGQEEIEIIAPAVEEARRAGFDATGPYPPDTIFHRASRGEFDVVVAMYHDQGHIPVKLAGFESGVNVSVGLPFVRTSVDHGTAFDIAGKGIASEQSLVEAIRLATVMAA